MDLKNSNLILTENFTVLSKSCSRSLINMFFRREPFWHFLVSLMKHIFLPSSKTCTPDIFTATKDLRKYMAISDHSSSLKLLKCSPLSSFSVAATRLLLLFKLLWVIKLLLLSMKLLFKFVDVFVIAVSLLPKSISLSSFGFDGISDVSDDVLKREN